MRENRIGWSKKVYTNNKHSYPITFAEVRKEFPGLFVCGPNEINKLFGFRFSEDLPAIGYLDILSFLQRISEDFSGNKTCAGLFLMTPFLKKEQRTNLRSIVSQFGDSFYRASWVLEGNFLEEQVCLSAVLITLGSNPVFRGKDWKSQKALAKSRGEEILSIAELAYTIVLAEQVACVKSRTRFIDRTKTICRVSTRQIIDSVAAVGYKDAFVCAGENNQEGMRIVCYGDTPIMNLGVASAVVRRLRG